MVLENSFRDWQLLHFRQTHLDFRLNLRAPHHTRRRCHAYISNAADALLTSDIPDKCILITAWHPAESIKITVFNNGPSIPKTQQNKVFAPFFTTKKKGKGLGLGMAIVHQIIQRHTGTIEVNSEEGKGVEFNITLPLDPLGRTQR